MTRARASQLLLLGALPMLGAARPAAAAQDEWSLTAGAGLAVARADGRWAPGGTLVLAGQYGLDDAWSVGGGVAASLHPVDADARRPGGRVRATALAAGVAYAVDVVRVVPFLALGLAVQNLGGALHDARTDLGVELGGGADYLVDRRWSLGLALAYRVLPVHLGGDAKAFGGTPQTFSAALRIGRGF
jgi:hypothetical protein